MCGGNHRLRQAFAPSSWMVLHKSLVLPAFAGTNGAVIGRCRCLSVIGGKVSC